MFCKIDFTILDLTLFQTVHDDFIDMVSISPSVTKVVSKPLAFSTKETFFVDCGVM